MGVTVREKKKGEWWIFIAHNGKRKSKKIGKDKKLAFEAAKKIEAKLALGDFKFEEEQKPKVPTLKQYVDGWTDDTGRNVGWFKRVAELSLKNSTRKGYRLILDAHLIPAFGNTPLDEITPKSISDFIHKCFEGGLRSNTIRNMKNCISAILRHACTPDAYIHSNPARGILIPHPEDEAPAREPDPFTWDDRTALEETFREHFPRHYPLILCGFRTGLRIGELIGLQRGDLDFRHRLIIVQRNITRGKITTPKSRSSRRTVRMTTQLSETLKIHIAWMKKETLRRGWEQVPEWLFCNEEGGFLSYPNFVHRVWNRAMEKSELRRRTPHDMRHTYATLRLSKGDSLAEVSKEMGHATTEITYRTYYKWLPKESHSNIDELDNLHPKMHPAAPYPHPDASRQ